jgi:hypothetical protein
LPAIQGIEIVDDASVAGKRFHQSETQAPPWVGPAIEAWIDQMTISNMPSTVIQHSHFQYKVSLDPDGHLTRQLASKINASGKAYMTSVGGGKKPIRWVTGQAYTEERHIRRRGFD